MHSPKNLYIQLTSKCNNQCKICAYLLDPAFKSSNSNMDDSTIKKLLENIKEISTLEKVYFGPMYGEGQLHPRFYEIVETIKKIRPDIFIILITNGKLLTKENVLKYAGDHIHLSVLGNKTRPDTYESITGLKWESLKEKTNIVSNAGISCGYNFTMTSLDDVEEAMKDLYTEENFKALYYVFNYPMLDLMSYLKRCMYLNIKYKESKMNNAGHLFDDILVENNLEYLTFHPPSFTPCSVLYNDTAIMYNGDVLLCACADIPMKGISGNINNNSLLEIYNNEMMNSFRNNLRKGVLPGLPCNLTCSNKIIRQRDKYKNFEVLNNV